MNSAADLQLFEPPACPPLLSTQNRKAVAVAVHNRSAIFEYTADGLRVETVLIAAYSLVFQLGMGSAKRSIPFHWKALFGTGCRSVVQSLVRGVA